MLSGDAFLTNPLICFSPFSDDVVALFFSLPAAFVAGADSLVLFIAISFLSLPLLDPLIPFSPLP
jgi:hypothetical protein